MLEEFTMKTTKRVISAALALLTALSLSAPVFADTGMQDAAVEIGAAQVVAQEADIQASSQTYGGNVLAAVNTQLITIPQSEGSFSNLAEASQYAQDEADPAASAEMPGVMDIYTTTTGETLYKLEPDLPDTLEGLPLLPDDTQDTMNPAYDTCADSINGSYITGSRKTLKSIQSNGLKRQYMQCLYVGTHCTVWGSVTDNSKIRIGTSQAAQIGQQFDNKFSTELTAFGNYWYDADGDGKIAIMCYDLESDYGSFAGGGYKAGYFSHLDLIDTNGYIKSFDFGSSNYLNGIDCIHIDTYPGMGANLNDINNCYSTLFHEFQHMINFSYRVKGSSYIESSMETYLNEAFSMAAEHMILGSSATSSRIDYFNSSSYIKGSALTYWGSTLSNYANSYLFGQYIRTRYAQIGKDGNTIYRTVMERRSNSNSDTLGIIADLLNTSKKQLILDFWTAVALKKGRGSKYGFNGESWASAIYTSYSSLAKDTSGIYNGGVKFYRLSSPFTPKKERNITFVGMNYQGPTATIPQAKDISVQRTGANTAEFTFTPTADGYLRYLTSEQPLTKSAQLSDQPRISVTKGQPARISITDLEAPEDQAWSISYYLMSTDGYEGNLDSASIPAYRCKITYKCGPHGTLQILNGNIPVENGELVVIGTTLTVQAIPDEGYALQSLTTDGKYQENGGTLLASKSRHVSATFIQKDVEAADSFASGSGSQSDPYVISTPAQWKYFASRVGGGDSMQNRYVCLSNDINFENISVIPVGTDSKKTFAGTFDGCGYTFSNFSMRSVDVGVFGYVTGTIKNLKLSNCCFVSEPKSGSTTPETYAGVIAAKLIKGTITDCLISKTSVQLGRMSKGYLGGVTGYNGGTISDCVSKATVTYADNNFGYTTLYVGGISGSSHGIVQNCHQGSAPTVSSTYQTITVYAGGICGYIDGDIIDCAANGVQVSGGKKAYVGGICGFVYGNIKNCVSGESPVSSTKLTEDYTGGIVGYLKSGSIKYCLAASQSVQGTSSKTFGRITGNSTAQCRDCYYDETMVCAGNSDKGTATAAENFLSAAWVKSKLLFDMTSTWETAIHPTAKVPTLQVYRKKTGLPITASSDKGTVSVLSPAFAGMTVTVGIVEDNLAVDSVTVDSNPIEGDSFVVSKAHTIYVTTAIACHITVVQPEKGSITVSKTKAKLGDTITVSTFSGIDEAYAQIYVDGKPISGSSFVVTGDHVVTAKIVSVLASGQCSTNVYWKLTEDGVLHILGTGAIETYGAGDLWKKYSDKIKHCMIEEGITSIPYLPYLQSVISLSIPASVTSISGSFDFYNELTAITVDERNANYCDIDGVLFTKDKTTLIRYPAKKPGGSYVIPDGVLRISEDAFYSCGLLTDIRIPASVTSISDLFQFCNKLTAITVDEQNASYCDADGVLFSKDKTALIRYPEKKPGSSYVVPDSVLRIGEDAFFNCDLLAELRIPASVREISDAFGFCSALAFFTVDTGNSSYCDFDGVLFNKDQTLLVCYPAGRSSSAYTIPDGVVTIEKYAFYSCEMLEALVIPSTIATIKDSAISCYHLDDVYYVGTEAQWNAIHIGSFNYDLNHAARHYVSAADACMITVLFAEHGSISVDPPLVKKGETVTVTVVPDTGYQAAVFLDGKPLTEASFTATGNHTVTAVFTKPYDTELFGACGTSGSSVFWALTDDGTLHIYGTGAMMNTWGSDCPWYQYRKRITRCEIELGVTSIGNQCFDECTALAQVIIPSGVTRIGELAFCECSALQSVTLPNSVTNIGVHAFGGTALSDVYYVGTEAQWNAINIDRPNNPDLTKAALHYLSASISARASDAGLQIAADSLAPAKLIAAFYDRQTGRMLCLRTYELTAGQTAFTIDTAALGLTSYRAKVMVLNGSNMPLCRAAEVRK